jgi:hypothetical protein
MVMVFFVTGGVELNSGLPVDQGKIDQILMCVWNKENESKGIRSLLEIHNQEIKKIKGVTRDVGPKFDKLIQVINEVITNHKQIKQTVKEWEERQQMVDDKVIWKKGTGRITY